MQNYRISTAASQMDEALPPSSFSVSEINCIIADILTANLPQLLSIEGEISNLSIAGSGHRYFSLKDNHSTISCALFRGSANRIPSETLANLKNGDKVLVKASISVYQPRGDYQLLITDIEPAGFGALAKAFSELKQKIIHLGYTDKNRKQAVPTWPYGIAVVTSETGAAIRDVISTLARRAPFIPINVYPTLVQGKAAPENIVKALEMANNESMSSVILLVRGGGSLEDLQAFNDESVAMAVVHSRLPVITGVGHETDFTIVDFVSDARAATPTAAAECASPDHQLALSALKKQQQRLHLSLERIGQQHAQKLIAAKKRLLLQHPQNRLQQNSQRLDELALRLQNKLKQHLFSQREKLSLRTRQLHINNPIEKLKISQAQLNHAQNLLTRSLEKKLQNERHKLQQRAQKLNKQTERLISHQQQLKGLKARLTLLSPLGILDRGYALAFDAQQQLIRSPQDLELGDIITIRLAQGELKAELLSKP